MNNKKGFILHSGNNKSINLEKEISQRNSFESIVINVLLMLIELKKIHQQ